ncbi:ubiquinol--cytochrome-c reductase subunit 6 [Orbilia brochopaga]|uniref:Cytochrome b-c1 complex subunit 6, mitochondrial n=1 Tax=Orbilia brochopaga TaxID=3140254 RepID=A0AAV9UDV1_9PEZI
MTLSQFLSDVYSSFTIADAKAEAPPAEQADDKAEDAGDSKEEEKEEEPAEEAEEEEEEPEDIMPKLQEECANTTKCAPFKHHYEECAERVQQWDDTPEDERKGKRESCVEEYFHLMHCAGDCVAPKLWAKLK